MGMTLFWLAAGFVALTIGAELLVRGASRFALRLGVAPLIVGLTVVAYGTSAPEMMVSVTGALNGQADIALGNVVGSNIFNVLFILGLSAILAPLVVTKQIVWQEVPVMIAASVLALVMGLDSRITAAEGCFFTTLLIAYTVFQIRAARRSSNGDRTEAAKKYSVPACLASMVAGLVVLVIGSRWLLSSAIELARMMGISELVIGLTIIAAGTSLPEVATSVLATLRGERDIAVGNVVGSNIFNILGVLGISSAVGGGVNVAPAALGFDMPIMIATALACLPIFFTGHKIDRWEGIGFLFYYAAYAGFLILNAQGHDALPLFNNVMLSFALPLTILTILIHVHRHARSSMNSTGAPS